MLPRNRTIELAAGLLVAAITVPAAAAQGSADRAWALEIRPLAERFESAEDARLLLTVRNVGSEPRAVALPWRAGAAWPQWIEVAREGERLAPAPDADFAAEPATLAPGEQLSVLVALDRFVSAEALRAAGPGLYELRWDGGTLGFATSATAAFVVTGAPVAGPAPGSLESFLPPARPDRSLADRVQTAWLRQAAAPSDPRAMVFLAAVPAESVDRIALFEMLEASRDLGVRRELVRLLGRIGRDELAAERLIELLGPSPDRSLASLASAALEELRGE